MPGLVHHKQVRAPRVRLDRSAVGRWIVLEEEFPTTAEAFPRMGTVIAEPEWSSERVLYQPETPLSLTSREIRNFRLDLYLKGDLAQKDWAAFRQTIDSKSGIDRFPPGATRLESKRMDAFDFKFPTKSEVDKIVQTRDIAEILQPWKFFGRRVYMVTSLLTAKDLKYASGTTTGYHLADVTAADTDDDIVVAYSLHAITRSFWGGQNSLSVVQHEQEGGFDLTWGTGQFSD